MGATAEKAPEAVAKPPSPFNTESVVREVVTVIAIFIPLIILVAMDLPPNAIAEQLQKRILLHGALVTAGAIVCTGIGVTAFRNIPIESKLVRKAIHGLFNFTGFALMVAGMYVMRCIKHDYHSTWGKDHFTSVHSWLGVLTVLMFAIMFVFGLVAFNPFSDFPSNEIRRQLKPVHVMMGVGTFALAMCTWGSGILQFDISAMMNDGTNVVALFGMLAMFIVLYTLLYRKQPSATGGL